MNVVKMVVNAPAYSAGGVLTLPDIFTCFYSVIRVRLINWNKPVTTQLYSAGEGAPDAAPPDGVRRQAVGFGVLGDGNKVVNLHALLLALHLKAKYAAGQHQHPVRDHLTAK